MTLGFVVGKFYPPHSGHKFLIESACRQVDQLVVMIAAHPSQNIPGEVRKRWLEQIHPDCDIRLVPDELEDDTAAWAKFTIECLGRAPDVVFTSEDYGPRFASLMGSRHVMIDRNRSTFPISGTKVRSNPLRYLSSLEPCVRAWYVLRVVLIGAESTGKTTLTQRLAIQFSSIWVPEYGREYWEKKVAGLSMEGPLPPWSSDEFLHIASTQHDREWKASEEANGILFCDTNAFATGTWHERYVGSRSSEVDSVGATDRVSLYLFSRADTPFVQDGFRDGEKIRHWMDTRFEEQLATFLGPVVHLHGDYEQRFQDAVRAVRELIEKYRERD